MRASDIISASRNIAIREQEKSNKFEIGLADTTVDGQTTVNISNRPYDIESIGKMLGDNFSSGDSVLMINSMSHSKPFILGQNTWRTS